MSSAQLEISPLEESGSVSASDSGALLRELVAERLAAHRARRIHPTQQLGSTAAPAPQPGREKPVHQIAAAVAARYAQSPTYRTFLAEEARRAMERADAAAEVAARNAEAVAVVQLQLLDDLQSETVVDQARQSPASRQPRPHTIAPARATSRGSRSPQTRQTAPVRGIATAGITVRLYEDVGRTPVAFKDNAAVEGTASGADREEFLALDEEIAFRQSEVCEFEEPAGPVVSLPANLLEFPRQLVAARRARPRLAEGPLREPIEQALVPSIAASRQLRIFEAAALPLAAPLADRATADPEWTSIWLDTPTDVPLVIDGASKTMEIVYERLAETEDPPPTVVARAMIAAAQVAPPAVSARLAPHPVQAAYLSHRLLAAILDAAFVFGGVLASLTAFALATGPAFELPAGRAAEIEATAMFFAFYIVYHLLFFTFSDSTPGMRYARIGLCTFEDDNPTRAAIRRRLGATLVAACPLGLGLLWALLDAEGLGWHDRISRMYPRSY